MSNYVDVKVAIWNRLVLDDTDMNEVISIIQKRGISAATHEEIGVIESKTLYETEQQLTPQENAGSATIEVYEKDKLKWDNSMNTTDTIGA